MPTTLIARAAEAEVVQAVLRRAAGGSGAAAVIEGEAGVGKTRLLTEIVQRARKSGAVVWHGTAEELARSRPFGLLADAFAGTTSPAQELLTSVALGAGPQGSSNGQFLVTEELLDHLERAAATGPVLLALDDLQWADQASLLAVQALTRRLTALPVALIVALRLIPNDPALERLLESLHDLGAEQVRLRPLGEDAVTALLTDELGGKPGPRLLALVRRAGGNPFYLHELVRTLRASDALTVHNGVSEVGDAAVPVTMGTTILRHLRYLSADTLAVLQRAAVLGSTFTVSELAAVSGHDVDQLLAPLQEAVLADLVHDRTGGFTFRHDLVRQAFYERIPRGIRRELHLNAGRALAAIGAPATSVATQFGLGAAAGDAEAISWLRAAADETRASAPGIGIGFLQQAIELASASDSARDRMRAELACLLVATGSGVAAHELIQQVMAAGYNGELDGVLRFATGQALFSTGRRAEAPQWLEQAAETTSFSEAERALIWAEAGFMRLFGAGDLAGGDRDARCAARLAEASGDHYAQALALSVHSLLEHFRGEVAAAIRSSTRGVELARGAIDPRHGNLPSPMRDPYMFQGFALLEADRLDEAEEAFRAGEQLSTARGVTGWCHYYHFYLGLRHYHAGAWDDMVAELETGLAFGDELGNSGGALGAHALLALVALHRDNLPAATEQLGLAKRRFAQIGPDFGLEWLWLGEALLAEANGDHRAARACLAEAWDTFAELGCAIHHRVLGPLLVRHAITTGDKDRALQVSIDLEAVAAREPVPSLRAAALRCRGLADRDVDALRAAVAACQDGARPLPRAATCEDAAAVISGHGRTSEARELFTAALDGYRTLGAARDAARITAKMRELGLRVGVRGRRGRPTSGWDSLTPTELRVAALVTNGLSNPEIGGRLFISRRTVETHLSHIFAKLQISSRAELAAEAARRT